MFRYALRRILWSIPTVIGTSLIVFFVTTLAPDPRSAEGMRDPGAPASDPRVEEARRAQFLDLPRFVNSDPQDVRTRAAWAMSHVGAGDAEADVAATELRRLGGACLPFALPQLEALAPESRGRLAVALGPIAERMGLASADDLANPEAAALFWTRFWDDRALDFTRAATQRNVVRLVEHGSELREGDLIRLDTFALPAVIAAMDTGVDRVALARLTHIARHAAERGPALRVDATAGEVRRAVADWREWWFVHATDFVVIEGADRAAAVVTETRYGKWLRRATAGELGVSAIDGEPIARKLRMRSPVTALICLVALALSWALAVPIGAFGAWRQRRAFDVTSSVAMFILYAMPTFVLAELLRRAAATLGLGGAKVALAVVALTAATLATSSRWQRTAMLQVMRQDFVRTAVAKGVPAWRVAVHHALRNALAPTVTLAGLHLPALVGGAFVVEEVFGLPGVGFETLRAIDAHDSAWLMAVVLATAVAVTLGLVLTDMVYGALDPRLREELARRQGGRAA
jgi:ABC-type dipeptide/oligopeptide/nickel transport system permease component